MINRLSLQLLGRYLFRLNHIFNIHTPYYIICSEVDDNVMNAKNASQVHPPCCYFFVVR